MAILLNLVKIICPRYCNLLALNGRTSYLPGVIILNTSTLFFRLEYLQYSAIYPHMKGIKSGQQ